MKVVLFQSQHIMSIIVKEYCVSSITLMTSNNFLDRKQTSISRGKTIFTICFTTYDLCIIKVALVVDLGKSDTTPIIIGHFNNYTKTYEKYCVIGITQQTYVTTS
jgi:hypothetical protein